MEALAQWHWFGCGLQQSFHPKNCAFFDDRHMRKNFGRGPAVWRRRFAPEQVADFVSLGQQFRARGLQMADDWREVSQLRISSNREATGLFKRTRQLQDAGFAEVAGEDLHADRQSGSRLSAGN